MTDQNTPADGVNSEQTLTQEQDVQAAKDHGTQPGMDAPQEGADQPQGENGLEPEKEAAQQPGEEKDGWKQPMTRRDFRIQQLLNENRVLRQLAERKYAERQQRAQELAHVPRPEEYATEAEYYQATATHAVTKAQADLADREAQEAQQQAGAAAEEAWREATADFRARVPDFDAVAHNPDLRITPVMADAIRDSGQGPELAYYLGKNPHEAARIASLPPVSQATAIARLETRVQKVQSKSQTKAPPPAANTLKGGNATGQKRLEDMSFEEYRKARGF